MFGKRPDGKLLKKIDPIIMLTSYLMPMRCDAQVMMDFKVDFEILTRYIAKKRDEGYQITFQELLIAAFVHAVAEVPEINRFTFCPFHCSFFGGFLPLFMRFDLIYISWYNYA